LRGSTNGPIICALQNEGGDLISFAGVKPGDNVASERPHGTAYIVDDDSLVRSSIEAIVTAAGFRAEKFASATHFLSCITALSVGCVLVDFRMSEIDGLELQEELKRRNSPLSVIILTGYADVPLAVRAIKNGALDILQKPFNRAQLLAQIESGIALSKERFAQIRAAEEKLARLSALTDREREVVKLLVVGRTNKEIAERLGLSSRTVEIHRAHLMAKLAVHNLPELLRVTGRGG
jgi:two-component system, LuxR family, response regulator FixJ